MPYILGDLQNMYKTLVMVTLIFGLYGCKFFNNNDDDAGGFNGASTEELASAQAYNLDSPYATIINACIRAKSSDDYCSFNTLPLIAMTESTPTRTSIINQLAVSHHWMGERFEEILAVLPDAFLPLFGSVTAIVIDDDIRPAYYTTSTGAIYLDPAYLWLSDAEAATISDKEDFRSEYSDPLALRNATQYVNGYTPSVSSPSDASRTLSEIYPDFARLLLHELAHANDFIPADKRAQLSRYLTADEAADQLNGYHINDRLNAFDSLQSQLMLDLAAVMYQGVTPSDSLKALTATQAGAEYETDHAADMYGFSSVAEDVAMLFEITTMKYLFDRDRLETFVAAPQQNTCSDYQLGWGMVNRYSESDIAARAILVNSAIISDIDWSTFFSELPPALAFEEGLNYCEARAIAQESASLLTIRSNANQTLLKSGAAADNTESNIKRPGHNIAPNNTLPAQHPPYL